MNNASYETRQQRRHKSRQEKKGSPKAHKGAFKRALAQFKERAEALKAASMLTPLLAKLALMDLAMKLGVYKSRGRGRGTPARRFGRTRSRYTPHQGMQEQIRRHLHGFHTAFRGTGLNKREIISRIENRLRRNAPVKLRDAVFS